MGFTDNVSPMSRVIRLTASCFASFCSSARDTFPQFCGIFWVLRSVPPLDSNLSRVADQASVAQISTTWWFERPPKAWQGSFSRPLKAAHQVLKSHCDMFHRNLSHISAKWDDFCKALFLFFNVLFVNCISISGVSTYLLMYYML